MFISAVRLGTSATEYREECSAHARGYPRDAITAMTVFLLQADSCSNYNTIMRNSEIHYAILTRITSFIILRVFIHLDRY